MDFTGVIVGAAVALSGSFLSNLISPMIARRAARADRIENREQEHRDALRGAAEEFLAAMWAADVEMSVNAVRGDDDEIGVDEGRSQLMTLQAQQRAEAHLALLLRRDEQPIHDLVLDYTEALFEREGRGDANEVGLRPMRQEVTTRLARWLSQDETAEQSRDEFRAWLTLNWPKPKPGDLRGDAGIGEPAR